jgi:photosystem II stability/assembly factor-like uncharacterized protein
VFGTADAVVLSGCIEEPATDCAPNLMRTSDGGLTWSMAADGAQLAGLTQISFAGGIGWGIANRLPADEVSDPNVRHVRRTLDGGRTWKTVQDPCPVGWPDVAAIHFIDGANGWIVCDSEGAGTMVPTAIYVTSDGGTSFVIRSSSDFQGPRNLGRAPSGPVGSIEAADMTTAFVTQGRSGTAWTGDGGAHWTSGPPGDPEIVFVDSMAATADGSVFALVQDGNLRQVVLEASVDSGRTWEARLAWPMR